MADVLTLLDAVTGTGTGTEFDSGDVRTEVGIQVETTGSPTFSVQVQGSLDGVDWFSVGSAITSATTETVVTSVMARYFQADLTALSGGTLTCLLAVAET